MTQKETPLNRQYRQIKEKYPDTVLLFRLGDFYETFGNDAIITAAACGITLTKRNNGSDGETPLAGFPHHQLDNYLPKLVRAGHKVAVCEQLEDPKKAKGIVRRGVVEVVTPGVVMYDKLLDHTTHTYLCALIPPVNVSQAQNNQRGEAMWGVAFADVSTGSFVAGEVSHVRLSSVLESYLPSEILINKEHRSTLQAVLDRILPNASLSYLDPWLFDAEFAGTTLLRHFNTHSAKGFGLADNSAGIVAAGVVIHYISETQRGTLPQLQTLRTLNADRFMVLDAATRRNLDIYQASGTDRKQSSLLGLLDRTCSPMGARLLRWWMQTPLTDMSGIQQRLDAVDILVQQSVVRERLRKGLLHVGDLERLITKVVTDRATARDLVALKNGLKHIPDIIDACEALPHIGFFAKELSPHTDVVTTVERALETDAPVQYGTGRMFTAGYSSELDTVREALTNGQDWIKAFQERERVATGIGSLKVAYNNVFGYYIEVSKAQVAHAPPHYQRKQTLANAERFTTPELQELESTIVSAESRITQLEMELLADLRASVGKACVEIQRSASALAAVDCLCAFAEVSVQLEYCKPDIHEGTELTLEDARHPVLENMLPPGTTYVPNTISLDTDTIQIQVITGPNMSGKSSYLRQTGVIVFMAHLGCFVPASKARIPLTDRIFTRVGAQDNMAAGESTFLVEMQESANIVHNATRRSLILLDEVGRGTATFDGISIAWAIAEYLHEVVGAKTLFATHYHELTALADRFERIQNVKVQVVETETGLVFTHRVVPGSADHSFGIHVARMAGMPPTILRTAQTVLEQLETGTHDPSRAARTSAVDRRALQASGQLTMFEVRDDELRSRMKELDVNSMTPMQALQTLAELKESIKS